MKDRQPAAGKEGRFLIKPENGSPFYATLEMADDATELGTPFAKHTMLKDSTAALFNLDANSVPDDVLQVLGRLNSGIGNEYVWGKTGPVPTPQPSMASNISVRLGEITCDYSEEVKYNAETSLFELVNPKTISLYYTPVEDVLQNNFYHFLGELAGKYCVSHEITPSVAEPEVVFFESAELILASGTVEIKFSTIRMVELTKFIGYVNSPDLNAYPPKEDDGCTYELLGQLGNKANIITGSYVGTGTNSHQINFEKLPVLLFIYQESITLTNGVNWIFWAKNVTSINPLDSQKYPFYRTNFEVSDNSLILTGNAEQEDQLASLAYNTKDVKYYYLGFVI